MRGDPAPAPRWGLHRLDARWAAAIVDQARIDRSHLVLDIGAGDGALTAPLARTSATVVAIELHPARHARLCDRFRHSPNVRVVRADAADLRLPRRPFRVVANPPFAASAALVKRLTASGSRLERADLVLPRAYARRWVNDRTRLARGYDVRVERALPRSATSPPAPMDLAVLVIERRAT